MSLQHAIDSFGVQLAFAEADAWDASLVHSATLLEERPVTTATLSRNRARTKTAVYGLASLALYAAAFIYADPLLNLCKQGKAFAVLPIATVFLFSWIHGNFTGNLWTALGIEASAKKPAKATVADAPVQKRPDARPRATVQA
ncbi:hypothetical protein [Megalodesulfovibrio paquesii]